MPTCRALNPTAKDMPAFCEIREEQTSRTPPSHQNSALPCGRHVTRSTSHETAPGPHTVEPRKVICKQLTDIITRPTGGPQEATAHMLRYRQMRQTTSLRLYQTPDGVIAVSIIAASRQTLPPLSISPITPSYMSTTKASQQ
jgi:hypothetical protein